MFRLPKSKKVRSTEVRNDDMDKIRSVALVVSGVKGTIGKLIIEEGEISKLISKISDAVDKAVKYGRKALYLINLADVDIVKVSQLADNFEKIEKELNRDRISTDKHRAKLLGYEKEYESHSIQERSFFKGENLKFLGMGSADEVKNELKELKLIKLNGKHLKEILGALHDHIVDMLNMHEDIIKLDAKLQDVLGSSTKLKEIVSLQVYHLSEYSNSIVPILTEVERLESARERARFGYRIMVPYDI